MCVKFPYLLLYCKGNPSDGFRGKTLSFLIENYSATVEVEANPSGSSSVRILDPLEVEGFIELDKHSRNIVRANCSCVYMYVCVYECIMYVCIRDLTYIPYIYKCMHTCMQYVV